MRASARYLLFIALLLPATGSAAPAFTLRTCFENSDSYPWLLQSGEGVVQYHLKAVATALDAEIVLTPLPWKRCLSRVSSGQMDAAIKMSYSVERATTVGVYPMREGKPDPAKRLLTESYSLYQLKGGKSQWDGTTLRVNGVVAAQSGFSIVDLLQAAGAEVDDSSRDPLIILKKLVMDRAQATAIQTEVADSILAAHPRQSRQVWDAIEQVRDSAAYQRYATALRSTPPVGE
ncbi:hypothetical protein ACEUAC_20480 [Aeromonas veronii]|uniref:hypothetical protein n=1 Tax=Aeromonas veronii TaxID=654 RepID=UPI001D0ABA50|nr:hypothetical protein [Aeromonas veronii]MCC0088336.1 hypothetical protein [Aeromonas veronii]